MDRETAELRRPGKIAKGVFGELYPGWDTSEDPLDRGVEAQVAASCLGIKPLYYDPWGAEYSAPAAEAFAGQLPPGVEIRHTEDGLYIYRPEVIEPIVKSAPAFYRPHGADSWSAIARVSPGHNGELLGYGCRSVLAGDVLVTIHSAADAGRVFAGFVAHAASAERWARRRAEEIERYTGEAITYTIIPR